MGIADAARGIVDVGLSDRPLRRGDPPGLRFTAARRRRGLRHPRRAARRSWTAFLRWIADSAALTAHHAPMAAPPTEHEILDVNRRYHDVAAESYDAKWGISFGEIGHQQVLGQDHEAARPAARPVRALARDRRRHGLLQPEPAADRRRRARRRARTSAPACSRRSSTTRASSASTSRPRPATPPSCRSRTRPSTSCSATPSCTTCPTSTAASREFNARAQARRHAVLRRRAVAARATGSPPYPSGRRSRPRRCGGKAMQGAARAARTTAPDEDEHALEAVVDVHAFVPSDLERHAPAPAASPTSRSAARSCWRTGSAGSTARWRRARSPRTSRGAGSSTPTAATSCSSAWTAALLEPRLPPRIFYNLMLAARKPG